MIFTRLELNNYGLFRGHHLLELSPRRAGEDQRRNIVLFGGKNGAGKTTILEAVRLCLYGQRSKGARVRRKDYEEFLAARIHRPKNAIVGSDRAAVALEFEHVHAGESSAYRVVREWSISGNSVDENLTIFRDGEELKEFDQEHWENFVLELVPPGVSQLFFFDGEKIQALADEEGEDSELASSIKALLGLDLADRLVSDLSVYIRRYDQSKERGKGKLPPLKDLTARKDRAAEALKRLKQERAQSEMHVRALLKDIQKVEDKISQEGGSYARQREDFIGRRSRAEEELARVEGAIRDITAELLPFATVPDQLARVREQLERDNLTRSHMSVAALIEARAERLRAELSSALKRTGANDHEVVAAAEAAIRIALLDGKRSDELTKPVHPVSDQAFHRLTHWIERASGETPRRARQLERELELITRELSSVAGALEKTPDEEALRPLLAELGRLHSELGKLEEGNRRFGEEIDLLVSELRDLQKKIEREESRLADSDDIDERVRTAAKVQRAVTAFAEKATAKKVERLRDHFRKSFATLSRKDDVIHDVRIDPQTFDVILYDEAGRGISKAELSAGEKQVYAIAMLWALATTSGRPLPFLIDTPLGRLDSDHRANIVNEYFPYVAHQVIIFSTDTEIDRAYFGDLEKNVARAYHLRYDSASNATVVDAGYFWEEERHDRAVESPAA